MRAEQAGRVQPGACSRPQVEVCTMDTQSLPRFQVYETVQVASVDPDEIGFEGRQGIVHSCSQDDRGEYIYGVLLTSSGLCFDFREAELLPVADSAPMGVVATGTADASWSFGVPE